MSSYFDDASLVMIPSGYKTSKVYSVKPTDGTGDLAFTRSNDTATRVGPDGLIEKVRTNSILQSEAFNTTWSVVTMSVTANTTANPLNGALTADTITLGAGTIQKYIEQGIVLSGNFTASVYLKAGTQQFVQFLLGTDPTPFANFDLVNGTASATGSTASIVSAGGGFFRCSMSFTSTIGTNVIMLGIDSLGATRFLATASTGNFIAFGYQLETGDIATPYIATTTAAVSVGPVANVPRLDYLNSSCPRLLLEPQRSNIITYSEQLNNAAWVKSNASVTANQTTSPSGYVDADKLVENSSSSFHDTNQQSISYTAAAYTISVFAKAAGRNHIFLQIFDGVTFYTSGTFNLSNGTVSGSGSIVSYGNGWYRCSFTATTAIGGGGAYINLSNGTTGNYAGDGTSGVFLYGAQVEAGAYATSYIPTLGASVTRGADAATKTGISSLIGQQEGVVFVDFVYNGSAAQAGNLFNMNNSTTASVFVVRTSSGLADCGVFENGTVKGQVTGVGPITIGTRIKLAYAYKSGSSALYINGTQIGTSSTTFTIPAALTEINFNDDTAYFAFQQSVSFNQHLLFTTRLTNAQLAELTTI